MVEVRSGISKGKEDFEKINPFLQQWESRWNEEDICCQMFYLECGFVWQSKGIMKKNKVRYMGSLELTEKFVAENDEGKMGLQSEKRWNIDVNGRG